MSREDYLGRDMEEMYGSQSDELTTNISKLKLDEPFKLPKGHQPLTSNSLFAQGTPPIGIQNTSNIDGILDTYYRMMFFGQLLANEHRQLYGKAGSHPYYRTDKHRRQYYSFWYEDSQLLWRLGNGDIRSGSIFDMIEDLYGIDLLQIKVGMLAKSLEFDFESLSKVKYPEHNLLLDRKMKYKVDIFGQMSMYDVTKRDTLAIAKAHTGIAGPRENLISSLVLYEWESRCFCVPASLECIISTDGFSPRLTIGKNIAPAALLNQHYFSKYPDATVMFVQDIRLALKLNKLLLEINYYKPEEFFITSMFGRDFANYIWDYLYMRRIVFWPAPTRNALALVNLYKKYSTLPGYENFRVVDYFLLPYQKGLNIDRDLSESERYIITHTSSLCEVNNIISFIISRAADTMAFEEFTKKYQRLGIFKQPSATLADAPSPTANNPLIHLPASDPEWELPIPNDLIDVRINHVLVPGNLVMLVGSKNAGKSLVSNLLIKSALHIASGLPLFDSWCGKPFANVFLVDGETEEKLLNEYLDLHNLSKEKGKRLFILSRSQNHLPEYANTFSLADTGFRQGLRADLIKHSCRLLILDNIAALAGIATYHPSTAQKILDWFRVLQKDGICIVFICHKSDARSRLIPDKSDGSQIFRKMARTIINIISKKEITIMRELRTINERIPEDGIMLGLQFSVCKTANILDGKTIFIHFSRQSNWRLICATNESGKEIEWLGPCALALPLGFPCTDSEVVDIHKDAIAIPKLESVHHKARLLYNILLGLGGAVRLHLVMERLGSKKGLREDTVRKILNNMAKAGWVSIEGKNSQGTKYRAIPNASLVLGLLKSTPQ